MKTYLHEFDLWEVVNSDAEPAPVRANPTVAQIRQHADERTKRYKAMSCIQNSVSNVIFTRIIACESPKQVWDKLNEEFQGTKKIRQQQLLNLRRDFENLKMKEEETFNEARIVEEVISTLPERYEAKISSLEDSRDLTNILFTELINVIYAQEKRRASRLEEHQEGVFQAKSRPASSSSADKGKKTWKDKPKLDGARRKDQPCRHCKRLGHLEVNCWFRPDVQYQVCKKMGHVEKVYRNKDKQRLNQPQQPRAEARVAEEESDQEEQVFAVSCSAAKEKATKRSIKAKVKVGNEYFIKIEGKGDMMINTPTGNKLVSNVLLSKSLDSAYTVVSDESKLWHKRLDHVNYKSMAQLTKEDLVENFTDSVEKEEVVKYFKATAETEIGGMLKTLRFDNGTEYTSAMFQNFCDKVSIKHQLTNTYTPQQNGVSERKNRSLMDMAKCLLFERNLPKTLWAEAINTVVYLQNRLSTKRDKLAKKAQPGIFVGYSSIKNGYRILDPSSNKVLVNRYVVFDEKSSWNWDKNEPEAAAEDLVAGQTKADQNGLEMDIDGEPIRGTKPLAKIYERAQLAVVEPSCFEEDEAQQGWKQAMVDEISMIEKKRPEN
ncbi:uncharacterized protein [Gossypium hirsutum]|uniref:Integrase catalytic domain-containing protein n=1 Tax=Gossypium hirsutum TaxID=3635 RepID=A0ABM2Z5S2_GOSHI|nr:uncharacterized protein LOC121210054 [Gossypium hirsutum]